MKLEQYNLFPTISFSAVLDNYEEINKSLLQKLETLDPEDYTEKLYGKQTSSIENWPEAKPLVDSVNILIDKIQDHLGYVKDAKLEASWIQIFDKAHRLEKHTHPNSWYSAAYYIQAEPGSGTFNLSDPRPPAGIVHYPTINYDNRDILEYMSFDVHGGRRRDIMIFGFCYRT